MTAPLARNLIAANAPDGWKATLLIFGIAFTAIMLMISTTMKYPPADWQPVTFAFGGWLAIAPTSTLILFRSSDYAKNYGIVFTAFGAGALLGTLTVGHIRDVLGSYTNFFYVTGLLAIVGIVLAVFMLKRNPTIAAELEPSK